MTPEAFRAWMQRRNLDPAKRAGQVAAGALLAASQGEVSAWQSGKRAVPRRVARICELLGGPSDPHGHV